MRAPRTVPRRRPRPAAVLAAALLLVAACAPGERGGAEEDGAGSAGPTVGDSLPSLPRAVLRDLEGDSVDLRRVVRGPSVVNFWATWCGPCRREMPELARLHADLSGEGVQVLGIAVSSGSAEKIRGFADRHGVEYRLLRASREWSRRHLRVFGMPTTLIVDRKNRIRARLVGPQTAERLREALEPLL